MSIIKKFLPGIIVISIGIVAAMLIVKFGPEPDSQKAEILPRTIRSIEAKSTDIKLFIESQGTVAARQFISFLRLRLILIVSRLLF